MYSTGMRRILSRTKSALLALVTFMLIIIYLICIRPSNPNTWTRQKMERVTNYTDDKFNYNLTVVTAYFNLGSFPKGARNNLFTTAFYRQWMTVFACIENPLVIYLDNDNDLEFFAKVRSGLAPNITKIIKVTRNELWSFGLESRIGEIFRQPGYPKHYPNTVNPAYSVTMHAKYELLQKTIEENPFNTKYVCWLDIGLFRDLTSPHSIEKPERPGCSKFLLDLPVNFSSDSVAYNQVEKRNEQLSPKEIVFNNKVSINGGYFVGERDVLYRWTQEYQNATLTMLANNLMSTDQQVIYSMLNTMNPKTKIQTYVGDGSVNVWFYLAYLSRKMSH